MNAARTAILSGWAVLTMVPAASAQVSIEGAAGLNSVAGVGLSGANSQPDAGLPAAGEFERGGGFGWGDGGGPCYANCDGSTQPPILNVNDFVCFLQKYNAHEPYANCDASTQPPVLNVNDFVCFLQKYLAGCP